MNAILSSGMLAASMLIGQTGEPPVAGKTVIVPAPPTIVQTQAQPQTQAQQPSRSIFGWWNREDRPIVTKIQSWWKREPEMGKTVPSNFQTKEPAIRDVPVTPVSKPVTPTPAPIPSNDFPRKLPNPQSKSKAPTEIIANVNTTTTLKVEQATLQTAAAAKNVKYPILATFTNRIGRDEKFEWITGQLETETGGFVLYYATPETIDKYNGKIVLQPQQVDMTPFKKGDLVSVRGQLAQRQTTQGMSAIYRLTQASLIERPKS